MKVLVINPGATSTKIAVFEEDQQLFKLGLDHSAEELDQFDKVIDQADYRKKAILDAVAEAGFQLSDFDAVCGRGGLMKSIPGGTYQVTTSIVVDLVKGVQGQHASNLGGILAREIADELDIPAYIVDPPVVDEMSPVAKYSGHPLIQRRSKFHALNQKAVAKRYAKEHGTSYDQLNLIVCHMGGGVSVGAHVHGKVVDVENAVDGDGLFSPERAGSLPTGDLVSLCFSGEYTEPQIRRMLAGGGGMVAYAGTSDMREVAKMAQEGNAKMAELIDAFHYQVGKEIGATAAAMHGKVDQIILTGGIAYGKKTVDAITDLVGWIAPITVYPGEDELLALAQGALRVLNGEEQVMKY